MDSILICLFCVIFIFGVAFTPGLVFRQRKVKKVHFWHMHRGAGVRRLRSVWDTAKMSLRGTWDIHIDSTLTRTSIAQTSWIWFKSSLWFKCRNANAKGSRFIYCETVQPHHVSSPPRILVKGSNLSRFHLLVKYYKEMPVNTLCEEVVAQSCSSQSTQVNISSFSMFYF